MKQPSNIPQHPVSREPKSPDRVDHYKRDGFISVPRIRLGNLLLTVVLLIAIFFALKGLETPLFVPKSEDDHESAIPWRSHPKAESERLK